MGRTPHQGCFLTFKCIGVIIMNALMNFMKDEDGLTAIEYVIAAALLVTGLTVLFTGYGAALATKLNTILTGI